jgi:hypothetical protein
MAVQSGRHMSAGGDDRIHELASDSSPFARRIRGWSIGSELVATA